MKRILLVMLILALGMAGSAFGKPAFGLKGGLNLANVSLDAPGDPSTSIKLGFIFGGSAEVAMTPSNKTLIRLEALYVMKGCKINGDVSDGFGNKYDYEQTNTINELVLAPFLVFRFPSEGYTPFIQIGPELGLNVTAKYDYDVSDLDYTDKGDIEDWSSTNFSLNIGGGVAFPSGEGEIVADVRYNLGLTNGYTGDDDVTAKTNGIQFLIGYNFGVASK